MGKTVAELFSGLDRSILGDGDVEVTGLAYRSDRVRPGDMFFCVVGLTVDGHTFAQDAIDRGAKALVVERPPYLADSTDVTEVVVADARKAMAHAAARYYDDPSAAFDLVGVTGTNGKTTTTYLVEHICRAAAKKTGVIGTVGIRIGDAAEKSEHTTPEAPDLEAIMARMRDAGCQAVAMEVSSHALDLLRTWGLHFAVTAFTNLTQDHLDYHHTFEAYFEAKALLFGPDYPARRVIGVGDGWGRELARRCREAGDEVITFGFDEDADIHPLSVAYGAANTRLVVACEGAELVLDYPLVGRFNVENVMGALAIGICLGIEPRIIQEALASMPSVPGRLERVTVDGTAVGGDDPLDELSIYVDYAHTPDALAKAIGSVKALAEPAGARTIVVFGCGGDRDAGKRPIMGRAALEADLAIVTSDNPRSEDPLSIIDDIVAGMEGAAAGTYEVVPDRRAAIARAIAAAQAGDAILIAGKGHEDYQIIGDSVIDFDDRKVAAEEWLKVRAR